LKLSEKIVFRLKFKILGLLNLIKSMKLFFKYSDTLFIIYSMGKTGSSSVYYTLMKEFPFNKVLHTHFLSKLWYDWFSEQSPKNKKKVRNQILSDIAHKYLIKKKNVITITIIRDPFSRSISDYFHSNENKLLNITDKQIMKEINESYYIQSNSIEWFEKDYNSHFNLDIYSLPFDAARGWEVYDFDVKNKALIIRIDVLTSKFEDAFYSLAGYNIKGLFITNRREDNKLIAQRYKTFKSKYTEDKASVEQKLNSKFVQHFFSKNQINKFREKYTSG
jgi:hypothetical protein